MIDRESQPVSAISVLRHPPEHGQSAPTLHPAGCCCCCCCCLHTLGGIGGGVLGSSTHIETHPARVSDPDSPFPYRMDVFEEDQPLISPVLLYWMLVALAILATIVGSCVIHFLDTGRFDPLPAIGPGLFVSVMILPGLQLAASVFAFIIIGIFYPERSYALRRVGRITIYSFAGTLLGCLLMAGCFGALSLAN